MKIAKICKDRPWDKLFKVTAPYGKMHLAVDQYDISVLQKFDDVTPRDTEQPAHMFSEGCPSVSETPMKG